MPENRIEPPFDSDSDAVWVLVDGEWFYRRGRRSRVTTEPPFITRNVTKPQVVARLRGSDYRATGIAHPSAPSRPAPRWTT